MRAIKKRADGALMDLGRLRVPSRGWFQLDSGADMELNGAVPDYIVWPQPGDMFRGSDDQLNKAIEVLRSEIAKWASRPQPKLRKASEKKKEDRRQESE